MRVPGSFLCLICLIAFPAAAVAAAPSTTPDTRTEVLAFVRAFTDAANRADVVAIMEMYDRSPDLLSVNDGAIARGWDAVREQANQVLGKQGQFTISAGSFDVIPLGANRALAVGPVVATVQTQRGPVQLDQVTTLVLEKRQGKWLIVHDHTSTKESDE
jgi:ketosteroid isomerase-like protein